MPEGLVVGGEVECKGFIQAVSHVGLEWGHRKVGLLGSHAQKSGVCSRAREPGQ